MEGFQRELFGQELEVSIEEEIKRSYLDYAMSVIIGRALPDVRDGLKPVHRRILFAMKELGNEWNKPYKKSARIVGDVIGKYHPHGDAAVYDALVRMAQDFSMRYPLVDGQGNFGSVDGDPPAAMRYTEVRMAKITKAFMEDIEKDTVDFLPNYDGSLSEPKTLPTRVPNLLINGSSGIAVGMATNIPPHNLTEVIEATISLIANPDMNNEKLFSILPGPDFPTAGFIYGRDGIREAYLTGKGHIKLRARAHVEKEKRIVITELPYQVNKAKLIEKIAELARDKRLEGVKRVNDESDREGLRIVIDIRKDVNPQVILNRLYRFTQMEVTYGINLLAVVNNRPELLTLRDILLHFINHRKEVVLRRTRYDLRKAEERAHILEGLTKALNELDLVISIIRNSKSPSIAKEKLMENLDLSNRQAQAILDMRLQRLTALEQDKIFKEYNEILKDIAWYKRILSEKELLNSIIIDELEEIKNEFGDERRSEIIDSQEEISIEDMIAEEEMVVTITHLGYIKRSPLGLYRSQRRGGKGVIGLETKENDFVKDLFVASTHSYFLFFTNMGRVHRLKVHEIPQTGRLAKGRPIVNLLRLEDGETITAILPVRDFDERFYVILTTANGIVKKMSLSTLSNIRTGGLIAISLLEGDSLIGAGLTKGEQDILLISKRGKAIRFSEKDVRPMGRTAQGVIGIRLNEVDNVVSMVVINGEGESILSVTENGFGKRTKTGEFRRQSRGGKGIIGFKVVEKTGNVVGATEVVIDDEVMLITRSGRIIRVPVSEIRESGRATMGVKLIDIETDENVVGLAKLPKNGT